MGEVWILWEQRWSQCGPEQMAEAQCNWIVMDYAEKGVKILKFCLGIDDMTKKKKKNRIKQENFPKQCVKEYY